MGWESLKQVRNEVLSLRTPLLLLTSSLHPLLPLLPWGISSHCFTSVLLIISSDACVVEDFHGFVGGYIHSLMVIGWSVGTGML